MLFLVLFLSAFTSVLAAFDPDAKDNFVVYWGQSSAGYQERLSYYCNDDKVDMVVVAFVTGLPGVNNIPSLNFANACYEQYGNGLLHCPTIAQDIKSCQSKGIKVLLSLGGASGAYSFANDASATEFSESLWNLFGEGSSDTRPFDDAVVDGFDLDIENNNPLGYVALVNGLRSHFESGTKKYYISAAPQCPNPDVSLNEVLVGADIDFAFIQFYNNYCNIGTNFFNFDTWNTWAQEDAYNKDIKLYLGIPGSATAAGSGYVSTDVIASTIKNVSCYERFGGISVWDASQAYGNTVDGEPWAYKMRDILDNDINSDSCSGSESSSASSVRTTSTSSSSTKSTTIPSSSSASITGSQPITTSSAQPSSTITHSSSSTTNSVVTSASTAVRTLVSTYTTVLSGSTTQIVSSTKVTSTISVVAPSNSASSASSTFTTTSSRASPSTKTISPTKTSSTQTFPPSSTAFPSDCSSLEGLEHAKCLNANFKSDTYLNEGCTNGDIICRSNGQLAMCDHSSWVSFNCAAGTTCYASSSGPSIFISCNFESGKSAFV